MSFQNEQIVETKTCRQCQVNFDITDKDMEFYDKVSPVFGDKKYAIPSPKLCPNCRLQRRLSHRNERKLYKRDCNASGKKIISIYSPSTEYKVYSSPYWWGDDWDPLDYGCKYNENKPFFPQVGRLLRDTPKRSIITGASNECEYVNFVGGSKDCYLIFDSTNGRNSYYSQALVDSQDCMDTLLIRNSQSCYECTDVLDCYHCSFIQNCEKCSDSQYLYNCKNCNNCFACVNLENKQYCIYNIQYSQDEYFQKLDILQGSSETVDNFISFKSGFPVKNLQIVNSENATGDIIHNSKNIKGSYEIFDSEDVSYSVNIFRGAKDCFDVDVGLNNSVLLYESLTINKNCSNILFCIECHENCHDLLYCTECKSCSHCFGCYGLRNKQYCILNKQYTKEEYEKLVPKIITKMQETGEWGEFFPSDISPFGYNETVAQEYYPLEKQVAKEKGFNWSGYEAPFPKVEKVIPASKLPENITDIPDDILNWAIECEVTKKPFRIIPQELKFYRKHNLPIPRRHPDQRHLDRMALRNPRKLFERDCDKCGTMMQTTYAPERSEKVYCEECYNGEVY